MEVKIALKQHVGLPCEPIVKEGDLLRRGQLIAVPNSLGAKIHASVSGRVSKIDDAIHIWMDPVQTEEFEKIPDTKTNLEAIEEAGVVGAGGAGFPTFVKLSTKIRGGSLIVNAAECEPLLNHNIEYIKSHPDLILRGLRYLMDICEAGKGYVAIKAKHREAIMELSKRSRDMEDIDLKFLPNRYPAGDERVIIREVLGEILEPGQLPSTYNSMIVNVETVKNCVLAIEERKPVISKDFTVAGKVKEESKVFFDQAIGMPVEVYIEQAGGRVNGSGELLIGGPFTGKRGGKDAVITKLSGGILLGVEFPKDQGNFGILACECGAGEDRLKEIVESMGGKVVAGVLCKRMVEVNGRYRCEKPGECPGQAEAVLKLKRAGAKAILCGSCED